MAPASLVPPSYEQEQHIRSYRACARRNEEMARLLILVWEETGTCDADIFGDVLTAHLRRQDTYHSWFSEQEGVITRFVLPDPNAIQLEARRLGEVTAENWRQLVTKTPSPFEWDCFLFGVLQREGGFTCFASIDHLHADSTIVTFVMEEVHSRYRALANGNAPPPLAPPAKYLDYCTDQRRKSVTATLADPIVADWVEFFLRNNGRMPLFPLPLGVLEDRCLAEHVHLDFLGDDEVAAFEIACRSRGARVIGGLLACAALTERALTGANRYGVITPTTTRDSPETFRMSGWCMGLVPIDFDIAEGNFPELVTLAQRVLDQRMRMAEMPIERVLELASSLPEIRPESTGGVMVSYMNMKRFPHSANIVDEWRKANGRVYMNQGAAAQVAIWFFRTQHGLRLTAAYPANTTARGSMKLYIEKLRGVCQAVLAI